MNLYLYNEKGEMELDWATLEALTSRQFADKIRHRYKSEKDNSILWARFQKDSIEVVIKRLYGVEIFSYSKDKINTITLTDSEITEIYQSL